MTKDQPDIRDMFAKQKSAAEASTPAKGRGVSGDNTTTTSAAMPAATPAAGSDESTAEQDDMKQQRNIKSFFFKCKGSSSCDNATVQSTSCCR